MYRHLRTATWTFEESGENRKRAANETRFSDTLDDTLDPNLTRINFLPSPCPDCPPCDLFSRS